MVEIIKPLAERTRSIYDQVIKDGYKEFEAIKSKAADAIMDGKRRRRLTRLSSPAASITFLRRSCSS